MTQTVFQTLGLTKTFGKVMAVDAVDIQAFEGEVFGFLGPNGAGKTTTLGMALGLVHPTAGEVEVLGERVTPARTGILRQVGALLGAPALIPYLSARAHLELLATLTPGIGKARIAETLELVGLTQASRRLAGRFSTGMKQRLGLAMALLHRPRLIILDEPTNGLDPAGMREIRELLRGLAEQGTSVILSSHLLNEVQLICDRIGVLAHGRLVAQGPVSELLAGQKPRVTLTISDPHQAADILSTLEGFELVSIEGTHLTVGGLPSETILARLMEAHLVPSEITQRNHDLETLFLGLTTANLPPTPAKMDPRRN